MAFPTHFARALAPVAAVAALAAPALAASTGELAQVEQHLNAAQSMTANFVQTDSKNRQLSGTMQLKRPGRIRCLIRRTIARMQGRQGCKFGVMRFCIT